VPGKIATPHRGESGVAIAALQSTPFWFVGYTTVEEKGIPIMAKTKKPLAFTRRKCKSCEGGVKPYSEQQIKKLLKSLPEWEYRNGTLVRAFEFMNFYQTMAFVNAVAWLANMENHHPDMEVGYSRCVLSYHTHAIGGISENDFICAAKINAMLSL
jgi:4a-hydroxytetrahydrobiopterin dehydratase